MSSQHASRPQWAESVVLAPRRGLARAVADAVARQVVRNHLDAHAIARCGCGTCASYRRCNLQLRHRPRYESWLKMRPATAVSLCIGGFPPLSITCSSAREMRLAITAWSSASGRCPARPEQSGWILPPTAVQPSGRGRQPRAFFGPEHRAWPAAPRSRTPSAPAGRSGPLGSQVGFRPPWTQASPRYFSCASADCRPTGQ